MKKLLILVGFLLALPLYVWGADTKGSSLTDGSGSISGTDYVLGYTTTGPASRRYTVNSILGLKTSVTGNAGTATALAADPAGCAGGQVTTDINASGVSSCTSWAANTLSLLGAADYAAMRTALGLVIGTNVQAYNSNLTAINQALTSSSNPSFGTLNLVSANALNLGTSGTNAGEVRFKSGTAANSYYFSILGSNFGANIGWTLPTAAPAGNGYLLTASTTGVLSYTDPSSLGGGAGVSDVAYDATTWDGVTATAPSKNAVRDYLESKLPSGSDGSNALTLSNNTAITPTGSAVQLYFEANILKTNQNGTESTVAIGPTAGQVSFTGPTAARAYALPDSAATLLYSGGALGTPSGGTLTNATGLPIATGISGLGTGIATSLAVNTGSAGAPVLFNGAGGTPTSLNLTNAVINSGTSLPGTCTVGNFFYDTDADTDGELYTCRATNTWKAVDDDGGAGGMATTDIDTSAELRAILTDEVGTGAAYFVGGALGTPASATLTNATGLPISGLTASTSTAIGVGTIELGEASDTTIARSAAGVATIEGVVMTRTIASGTSALGTGAIASGACATAVTTTATGTATTDVINWGFNGDPTGVTGYAASANGMLTIIAYPSANNVNYKVCNNTAASITPGAITLNWQVTR